MQLIVRLGRRPARPRHRPGRRDLHRLGLDRPQAAQRIRRSSRNSVRFTDGGRQPQRRDPRPRRRAGHAGVRPVRQGGRARDDGKGRPEVHRHPPRDRAARLRRRGRRRAAATGSAKAVVGDPRRRGRRAWAPLASLGQREEVRERIGELAAEAEIVVGDPDARIAPATPRRAPSSNPVVLHCRRRRGGARHPRRRGLRPGLARDALRRPRRGDRARQARQGQPRRLGLHRRPDGRGGSRARPRAVPRPRAGRQPRLRREVHRPRLAAAGAGPRRPGPRRRRRGDGRHPRREALHAAHRRPGHARASSPPSPAAGSRAPTCGATASTRSASRSAELEIGDTLSTATRARSRSRTSSISPHFTGDTFYAHMDEAAAKANPLFGGPRRPRLPRSSPPPPACSSIRRPGRCWPTTASTTCASSRRSTPATRISVRLTCKENQPARGRRATARCAGIRQVTNQAASSSPATTC